MKIHFTEFLGDTMLDALTTEFGDIWYKIYVLLGVTFSDIEAELTYSTNVSLVKKRVSFVLDGYIKRHDNLAAVQSKAKHIRFVF